jgi:ribonuclease P protein component
MSKKFCTLQKRKEFLKVSGAGKRFYGEHFLVQALPNTEISGIFRVGYVATRKTGNAVKRNKAKRRLRSLVYHFQDRLDLSCDYVFVARSSLWSVNFETLQNDFEGVLTKVAKMDKFAAQSGIDGSSASVSIGS